MWKQLGRHKALLAVTLAAFGGSFELGRNAAGPPTGNGNRTPAPLISGKSRTPRPRVNLTGLRLTNAELRSDKGKAIATNDDRSFDYMSRIAAALDLKLIDIRPLGRQLSNAKTIDDAIATMNRITRPYGFRVALPTQTSFEGSQVSTPIDRLDPDALRDVLYDFQDVASTLLFLPARVVRQSDLRTLNLVQTLQVRQDSYLEGAGGTFLKDTISLTRTAPFSISRADVEPNDASKAFAHEFGHALQSIINLDPKATEALGSIEYHPDTKPNDVRAQRARRAAWDDRIVMSEYSDESSSENTADIVAEEVKASTTFPPSEPYGQTARAVVHALDLAFPGMTQYLDELHRVTDRTYPYRAQDFTDCNTHSPAATVLPSWAYLNSRPEATHRTFELSNVLGTIESRHIRSQRTPVLINGKRIGEFEVSRPTYRGVCGVDSQASYQLEFFPTTDRQLSRTTLEVVTIPETGSPLGGSRSATPEIVQSDNVTTQVTVSESTSVSLRVSVPLSSTKTVEIRARADLGGLGYPEISDAHAMVQTNAEQTVSLGLG